MITQIGNLFSNKYINLMIGMYVKTRIIYIYA